MKQHLRWLMQGSASVAFTLMLIGVGPCWFFGDVEIVIEMVRACLLSLLSTMTSAIPLVLSLCLSKAIMVKVWLASVLARVVLTTTGSVVIHLFGKEISIPFFVCLTLFYVALLIWEAWAVNQLVKQKVFTNNTIIKRIANKFRGFKNIL